MKTLIFVAAIGSTSSLSLAAAPEKSLCHADETVLFQCTVKSKQAVLCASAAGKGEVSKLQYRYGTEKKIELSYPDMPEPAAGKFFQSDTGYSGGGEAHIRFKNGGYDYFLFQRTIRTGFDNGHNKPEFSAGIVTRSDTQVSTRLCKNTDPIKAAAQNLPEEEFEYLNN